MPQATDPIPLQTLLAALQDEDQPLNARFLFRLSDLDDDELQQLRDLWPRLPLWRRRALMEDIEEVGEDNLMLSFLELSKLALQDEDPTIRAIAIRSLWDYAEPALLPEFIRMLQQDNAAEVRAAAASALGRFIYEGEVEELSQRKLKQVEEALLKAINSQDVTLVRRRALEALGFSSREEVEGLIENAYQSGDKDWMASALFAMGRSADEVWQPQVIEMLDHTLPALRAEAARAAGELEMKSAVPRLVELVDDSDPDTRDASIWSLSQIGGPGVRELLEQLYERADDDEDTEFLQSALDNLEFTEGLQLIPLIDLDEEDLDEDDDELPIEGEFGDDFYYYRDFDEDEGEDEEYDEDEEEG